MQGLIGDRFLKRFFGSRSHRRGANPADEALTLPETEAKEPEVKRLKAEKPAEQGCPPRDGLPKEDATLENKKTGEIKELASPENGSDQTTIDH